MSSTYLEDLLEPVVSGFWGESEQKENRIACRVVRNGDVSKDGYIDRQYLPVRFFSEQEKSKAGVIDADIILVSSGAYTGNAGIVVGINDGLPVVASNFVRRLRASRGIDTTWLFHLVRSEIVQRHIPAYTGGSAIPNLHSDFYSKCIIPHVPDFQAQQRIAEILSTIDEVIEQTVILVDKINNIKRGFMQNIFCTNYFHNKTRKNKTFLRNCSSLKGGTGFPESLQGNKEGDLPFIKVSDMSLSENSKYIRISNNYVSIETAESLSANIFPASAIVFAKVGAALMLNRRRILTKPTIIDNNMMAAVPTNVEPRFLYHFLCCLDLGDYVQTGALPSVNQSMLGEIPFPDFDRGEQIKIADILDGVDDNLEENAALLAKLQQVKTGLMQDLLTGRVRVPATPSPSDTAEVPANV